MTIPGSGSIDNHTDYDVLVLANASVYFSGMDWDAYCAGQTENAVRVRLRGEMPLHSPTDRTYKVTDDCLPMSGIAFKEAGKDMSVQLLRAAVRIDVRVAEDKKGTVLLKSAVLRNVSPDIPMFNDPQDAAFYSVDIRDYEKCTGAIQHHRRFVCYRSIAHPAYSLSETDTGSMFALGM